MRILFLTQYFPPEVGAPQNRIFGMALNLQKLGVKIGVLTGMPNYPTGVVLNEYRGSFLKREKYYNMLVYRAWLFTSKNKSIIFRLLNYFSFAFSSFIVGLFIKKYDIIITESPPLFLGVTGLLLSKIKGSKFIFNVSDLWPESIIKLGYITNKFIISVFTRLEEFLYNRADLISVQTKGILNNIKNRIKDRNKLYLLYNGVDVYFWKQKRYTGRFKMLKADLKNNFVCGYIGNHGYAQGLDVILKAAFNLQQYKIKFLFVGDGPEKVRLMKLAEKMQIRNIIFHQPVEKKYIPEILRLVDVVIVPLKDIDLFKGAIPSKMFEFMAAGKAILLGVRGEAMHILNKAQAGRCFEPDSSNSLTREVLHLYSSDKEEIQKIGKYGRDFVFKNFNREDIAKKFLRRINLVI